MKELLQLMKHTKSNDELVSQILNQSKERAASRS
jgi:hypothetical protein